MLIVLATGVYVAGMFLPPNHTAARTATLAAPPDTVWAVVTDVAKYPRWRSNVDSVEVLQSRDGRLKWRETSGGDRVSYEATAMTRPSQFVARITDRGLPYGGSWDYRILPDGTGSRVTITENGEVYSPIYRIVSRYVTGHTATIDKYLGDLAGRVGGSDAPYAPVVPEARASQGEEQMP